jgi:sensor domain DACNV-containing protein
MTEPAYPAARAVAPRVQAQFAVHLATLGLAADTLAGALPAADDVEAIIDAAFWASLRREEGYAPKISLALLPRAQAPQPLIFEKPIPLRSDALVRVAPAVERPGIHLGVWREDGVLRVWGTTREIPIFCFVLEVAAPGLLVVKHHRGEVGKFVNVAVLEGDQIKVIDEMASSLPDCPSLLTSLLGFDTRTWPGGLNVLVQLAVSMRAHGRGGSLLVVPSTSDEWLESIVRPISYAVMPPFSSLADLVRIPADRDASAWEDAFRDAVESIAGLTAVDGATILTDQYELLAFGAKIARRRGSPTVEQIVATEPIVGAVAEIVHPTRLGGTRHLSAAQFVHDQHNALALVASQDGRFTVFAWSPCEDMVHAHRVEALLL